MHSEKKTLHNFILGLHACIYSCSNISSKNINQSINTGAVVIWCNLGLFECPYYCILRFITLSQHKRAHKIARMC